MQHQDYCGLPVGFPHPLSGNRHNFAHVVERLRSPTPVDQAMRTRRYSTTRPIRIHQREPSAKGGALDDEPRPPIRILQREPAARGGALDEEPRPPIRILKREPAARGGALDEVPRPPIRILKREPAARGGALDEEPRPPIRILKREPAARGGALDEEPRPPIRILQREPAARGGALGDEPRPPIRILQREPAARGEALDTEPRPSTRYDRSPGGRVQDRAVEPLKQRLARARSEIRTELACQGRRPDFVSRKDKAGMECVFCRGKKEAEDIVHSHKVKDGEGLVTCPILRQYECHLCHATGDHAHTIKWCPLNTPGVSELDVLVARKRVELSNRKGR